MRIEHMLLSIATEHLTIADHVRDTPVLMFGVFSLCLSAAFLV